MNTHTSDCPSRAYLVFCRTTIQRPEPAGCVSAENRVSSPTRKGGASSNQAPGPISARAAHRVAIMIQRHGCPDRKAYDNASPASTAPTIGVHNMLRGAEVQDR